MTLRSILAALRPAPLPPRARAAGRRSGFRPRLEPLEDRTVPSTLLVENLADSGPGSLRQAVLDAVGQAGPGWFDVKDEFADDGHVCVVGRLTAESFSGNDHLRGSDVSFSTYQCLVYRIADGKVTECTAYVNWLDPYVQFGLVDPSSLAR